MDSEYFKDMVLNPTIYQIRETLESKATEYAIGGDRMHNFNSISKFTGSSREEVAFTLMLKHLVSIRDMVESSRSYEKAFIDEKINDCINYLILIKGMLYMRENKY